MERKNKSLRDRGWSIQSEQSADLHHEEKLALLQSIPISHTLDDDDDEEKRPEPEQSNRTKKRERPNTDDDDETKQQHKKRRILDIAKTRLSKWAVRLFDPNRRKGLVEPPKTIPLNDEFLTAFGKREKELDKARGVSIEIDNRIDDDNDDEVKIKIDTSEPIANDASSKKTKVKITNLKFTTTAAKLQATCAKYGPIVDCNLIMDKDSSTLNTGRAYLTFETPESAQVCIDNLKELDGRALNVSLAADGVTSKSLNTARGDVRYWQKDISTKCYNCGQVGHVAQNCTNSTKVQPCPLCALTDHDFKNCPSKAICFNCGVPGHIARYCTQPRGMPVRRICALCFETGHDKFTCRRGQIRPRDVQDAICLSCGKTGHFLCKEMRWFFGLQGVSCWNCGRSGHIGVACDRPNMEACLRNSDLLEQEIARASILTEADNVSNGKSRNQNERRNGDQTSEGKKRGRNKTRENDYQRAKSMPPPTQRKQQQQKYTDPLDRPMPPR